MSQGKAYDSDVRTEVERLCLEKGLTAAEIVRHMELDPLFADRCPKFIPGRCDTAVPPLLTLSSNQQVRCVLYEQ